MPKASSENPRRPMVSEEQLKEVGLLRRSLEGGVITVFQNKSVVAKKQQIVCCPCLTWRNEKERPMKVR